MLKVIMKNARNDVENMTLNSIRVSKRDRDTRRLAHAAGNKMVDLAPQYDVANGSKTEICWRKRPAFILGIIITAARGD